MNMQKILIVLTGIVGLILAACTPISPVNGTPPAASNAPIHNTGWILESLNGQPALTDTQITLNFENGTLSGSDGCNQYGGPYTADGEKITVSQEIATTLMACAEPIMQQSSAYFSALAQAATYTMAGQQLTLLDANGLILAIFNQQNRDLSGTSWTVTGYNTGQQAVVSVSIGSELSADFGADGRISGLAGCNSYTAVYGITGSAIQIGPAATTRKMCAEPVGVMEQEASFLAALGTAATYGMDGDQLDLRTADGALAVTFTRSSAMQQPTDASTPGVDPENATYLLDGQAITLVNGVAEIELAPGSASKQVTRYFGNAVEMDLDGDGLLDSAFLLVQESGGSGTFYYVVAALNRADGYVGTNGIFLGDRIAPQSTAIDPTDPSHFVVSFGERAEGDAMASAPTQMASKTFTVAEGSLVEVNPSPTQTP